MCYSNWCLWHITLLHVSTPNSSLTFMTTDSGPTVPLIVRFACDCHWYYPLVCYKVQSPSKLRIHHYAPSFYAMLQNAQNILRNTYVVFLLNHYPTALKCSILFNFLLFSLNIAQYKKLIPIFYCILQCIEFTARVIAFASFSTAKKSEKST